MIINPPLETEATLFACLILMPEVHFNEDMTTGNYDFRDDKDLIKLAKKYDVPLRALILRIQFWNKQNPLKKKGF